MMNEIVYPWEIDHESEAFYKLRSMVSMYDFPDTVWMAPDNIKMINQVADMVRFCSRTRNWVLCFCSSPSYMREMYICFTATWVCSNDKRFCIADIDYLVSAFYGDEEKRDNLEHTDLLIIPYVDRSNMSVVKIKGFVLSMLQRRKVKRLATVYDIYTKKNISSVDDCVAVSKDMLDTLGEMALELFVGNKAKYVYISLPE